MTPSIAMKRFARPVDADQVERDWRARGFSCERWADPPGRQWNDFVHDTDELVTVVEGRLRLFVGDISFVAEPGDEVVIPRGASHSVHNLHDGETRWLFGYGRA